MNKRKWLLAVAISSIFAVLFAFSAMASHITYVVKAGDNMYRISLKFNTTVRAISEANNIVNPNYIYVGQVLVIPHGDDPQPTSTPQTYPTNTPQPNPTQPAPTATPSDQCQTSYVVQPGDTLAKIGRNFGVSVAELSRINNIWNPNYIYVGQRLTIPCNGPQPQPTATPQWNPTATPQWNPTATPQWNPTNTPVPQATNTPVPQPTNTPAPQPSSGFEIGGQTHNLAYPDIMKSAGMNWVKFQHKWSVGDTGEAVRSRIEAAHRQGFKVLLSIPGSDHTSIDYGAYVTFLGQVAALGPDAIEVWNEGNIDREWPAGQISATTYVQQMLQPAYQAIKAANSNVMVISGAPAPTGFFGGGCGGNGCDDKPYMEEMVAAGGLNYMDCVGIHYNEGILSPTLTSGDPRGNPNHYTRYFWTMVNTYNTATGYAKPLCFTELGYLSGDDFGGVPGGFSWASNTSIAEHAQWLGEAMSEARKGAANTRLVIVFNVDFTTYNEDPQAGFAMRRPDGSCPSCALIKAGAGK